MSATLHEPAEHTALRALVEELVCGLPGIDVAQISFEDPWEIRAFAIAVAAHREGRFTWPQFQSALIASIRQWEATGGLPSDWSYYTHWVAALEQVLSDEHQLDRAGLDERMRQVLAVPASTNHHEAHTAPIAVDPAR